MRHRAFVTASVTFGLAFLATTAQAQAQIGSFCLRPLGIPDKWIERQTPPWDPTDTFDPTGPNPDIYASGYDSVLDQGLPMSLILYDRQDPPQGQSAWAIEVSGPGSDAFQSAISGCSGYPHAVGETFPSVGNMPGPLGSAMEQLIAQDPNATWNPNAHDGRGGVVNSAFLQSPRVIALPVFAPNAYGSGSSVSPAMVKIVGFFVSTVTSRGVINGFLTGWSQLVVPSVTGRLGESVQLAATFAGPGSPIFGVEVEFLFEDRVIATAQTDGTGTARPSTTAFRIESSPGFYPGAIRARLRDFQTFFVADESAGDLTVSRKLPFINWPPPADITYGTPLGPNQLNATADVEGQFTYSPAAGAILSAKQFTTLTVTFVPSDPELYEETTASTYLMVLPAQVTVKVNDAGKFYLDPLPTFTLTATGLVNGDTASAVFGGMTFQTSATPSSPVGTYTVSLAGAVGAENYAVGFYPGTLTIAPRPSATTLQRTGQNPSTYGQTVGFTVTVASALGVPTGTATLLRGDVVLATGTLVNGQASFNLSSLGAGSHPLSAQYAASGGFAASSSPFISHTVNRASTTTQLTSSVNPSRSGQAVTLTAIVNPVTPGAGTVTGAVEFLREGGVIATVTLSSGRALLTTSTLAVGKHSIQARYVATTNYAASVSAVMQQTVKGGGK